MTINLIADVDCSGDLDDFTGQKFLAMLHRQGYVNLLGQVVCVSNSKTPGAIDGAMRYHGITTVRIGCWKGAAFDPAGQTVYTDAFYGNLPRVLGLASTVEDAVTTYRTLLAARTSPDVTIYAGGLAKTLNALLTSPADGISSLTGAQLIAASVKDLFIAGGYWPNSSASGGGGFGHSAGTPEWNFANDTAAWNNVVTNWPTHITFQDIGIADSATSAGTVLGSKPTGLPSTEPATLAFTADGTTTRPAWEELGYLGIVAPSLFASVRGTGVVNASTGANTWTTSTTGPHHYQALGSTSKARLQTLVNSILSADIRNSNPFTWGTEVLAGVRAD